MRSYEMRHVVAFEETNVVGNVYYANHIRWQGRCRELFLRDHAPEILSELSRGLALVTVRVSCDYYAELLPFDEVAIRMTLVDLSPHRMSLRFEYYRVDPQDGEALVARGDQELACMRRHGEKVEPERWPESLREALRPYAES
jgi:enediyne biosynthesis thioesterase